MLVIICPAGRRLSVQVAHGCPSGFTRAELFWARDILPQSRAVSSIMAILLRAEDTRGETLLTYSPSNVDVDSPCDLCGQRSCTSFLSWVDIGLLIAALFRFHAHAGRFGSVSPLQRLSRPTSRLSHLGRGAARTVRYKYRYSMCGRSRWLIGAIDVMTCVALRTMLANRGG